MKHPGVKPWFERDKCGPLFVYYCEREGGVDWYVCPDDEDKSEERAYAEGCAPTVDLAMQEVASAVTRIANKMLAWTTETEIGAAP